MGWYIEVLKKYAVFGGRAGRKEYWQFFLINTIIALLIALLEIQFGSSGAVSIVYSALMLVPSVAVSMRRLHDTDRSGWWMLLNFLPLLGIVVLIFFFSQAGTEGVNKYGPDSEL